MTILVKLYYFFKPFVPQFIRIFFRRRRARQKLASYAHIWPIDDEAKGIPKGWTGWPQGKRFVLVLTHDVETKKGYDRCKELLSI